MRREALDHPTKSRPVRVLRSAGWIPEVCRCCRGERSSSTIVAVLRDQSKSARAASPLRFQNAAPRAGLGFRAQRDEPTTTTPGSVYFSRKKSATLPSRGRTSNSQGILQVLVPGNRGSASNSSKNCPPAWQKSSSLSVSQDRRRLGMLAKRRPLPRLTRGQRGGFPR